jgi:hypothetical protein
MMQLNMKKVFTLPFCTLALLSLILALGCATPWKLTGVPVLLSANFESDAINAVPDPSLPGDPAGDRIETEGVGPNVKIIQVDGNKWLSVLNSRDRNEGGRLRFKANAVTYPARIFYSWKLIMVEGLMHGSITMALKDGAGNTNVELRLEDSRIDPQQNAGFGYLYLMPGRELLGKLPLNQSCDFFLEVNHTNNRFNLAVSRPAAMGGTIRLDNRALNANSPAGVQHPVLEISNYTTPPEFTGFLVNPTSGTVWMDQIQIKGAR